MLEKLRLEKCIKVTLKLLETNLAIIIIDKLNKCSLLGGKIS